MMTRIKMYLAMFVGYLLGRWHMAKFAIRLARKIARNKLRRSIPIHGTGTGSRLRHSTARQRGPSQLRQAGTVAAGAAVVGTAAYLAYRVARSEVPADGEEDGAEGDGPADAEQGLAPEPTIPSQSEEPPASTKRKERHT